MRDIFFTKREWEVVTEADSEHYCLTVDCGGVMRVNVITSARDITFSESIERIANAHLIAAAPDMYAELEDLEVWLKYHDDYKDWYARVKKLLAKARGEQIS